MRKAVKYCTVGLAICGRDNMACRAKTGTKPDLVMPSNRLAAAQNPKARAS